MLSPDSTYSSAFHNDNTLPLRAICLRSSTASTPKSGGHVYTTRLKMTLSYGPALSTMFCSLIHLFTFFFASWGHHAWYGAGFIVILLKHGISGRSLIMKRANWHIATNM